MQVDIKEDDVVAVLIGHQQASASRVEFEITRCFTLRREMVNHGQGPRLLVDGENGDAVVSAIGGEEKLAVRVNMNLCGVVISGKSGWQG